MNDLETQIRDAFRRHEKDSPSFDPTDARRAAGRTRRRQILNLAAIGVGSCVLVVCLVAGLGGIVSGDRGQIMTPMGSPSSVTPSPGPFAERFDSPLHGLSIGYPSGWQTRAATEPWGHDALAFDAPDVDVIFDPTFRDDFYFALVSEPLEGQSGAAWVNDVTPDFPSAGVCEGGGGGGGGNDTLDGADGWFGYGWSGGCYDAVAIVATATRGYIIYLHVGDGRLPQAALDELDKEANHLPVPPGFPRDWFDAALDTVDLRAEDAVDVSAASESP